MLYVTPCLKDAIIVRFLNESFFSKLRKDMVRQHENVGVERGRMIDTDNVVLGGMMA
jgi:hypothetical protein